MKIKLLGIIAILITIVSHSGCFLNNKSTAELLLEKGGLVVTLEIQEVDYVRSMAANKYDTLFNAVLNKAIELKKSSQSDFITLFGNAFDSISPKGSMLASLFLNSKQPDINYQTQNKQVLDILRKEMDNLFNHTIEVLKSRIEYFGEVKKPNIQRIDSSYRIKVELPEYFDTIRVRKLIQTNGQLEFWETWDNTEFFEFLRLANNEIKKLDSVQEAKNVIHKKTGKGIKIKVENDSLALLIEKVKELKPQDDSMDENLAKVENKNPLFSILMPSVGANGQFLKGAIVGVSKISDTAKVNEYLRKNEIIGLFPKNVKLLWEYKPIDQKGEYIQLVAIKISNHDGLPVLTGDVISDAKVEYTNFTLIILTMNTEGAKIWENLTGNNIGKSIAIVFDNHVYSAPIVNGKITGGNSQIAGNFTMNEAQDLVNILKSGTLYLPLKIIKEDVIAPAKK
jgi:SecD/SecF fusion protein